MSLLKNVLSILAISASIVLGSCKDEAVVKGDVLFEQGKYEEAVAAYDEYLKLNPTHVKSIYNKGRAYEELGQYDKALETFRRALEIDGKNVAALLSVGQYYYRKEDYKNAAFNFDKAVTIDDSNSKAHFLLGRSYHLQGMVKEAMGAYDNAISLNKELGDAYLYRGALRVNLKQRANACSDFKIAKSLGVKDADEALSKYCN